jgi:hypothetical protein
MGGSKVSEQDMRCMPCMTPPEHVLQISAAAECTTKAGAVRQTQNGDVAQYLRNRSSCIGDGLSAKVTVCLYVTSHIATIAF